MPPFGIEPVLNVVGALLGTWLPLLAGANLAVATVAVVFARGDLRNATAEPQDGMALEECSHRYGRAMASCVAAVALVALALLGKLLVDEIAPADATKLWVLMGLMIAVLVTSQLTRRIGDWCGERACLAAKRTSSPGSFDT